MIHNEAVLEEKNQVPSKAISNVSLKDTNAEIIPYDIRERVIPEESDQVNS
ncbi:unnamed protein product [marine sediment metagenome]|uniref:Uncharacterized protein n=1 Tax=marine sediment metagenome TaxID=412755 RepID=X0YE48_9ZZZZ